MVISPRHVLAGKLVVLVIAALVAGYFMTDSAERRVEKGTQLTIEDYTAGFEAHKAKQTKPPIPQWGATLVVLSMMVVFFGVYEGLGQAFGFLVRKAGLLPDREPEQDDEEVQAIAAKYPGSDLSMSVGKVHLIALALAPAMVVPILAPYWMIWGFPHTLSASTDLPAAPFLILLLLASIVFHEGLHGLGFVLFGRVPWSQIKFGVYWRYLAPYASCKVPVTASAYRFGVTLPGLMLGVVPSVAAITTGHWGLLLYGLVMTGASVGDLAILLVTRTLSPDRLVLDHPRRAGCWVLDEAPETLTIPQETQMTDVPSVSIDAVRIVLNDGNHNAFTDLCRFQDRFYLCFRSCPDGHGVYATACVVILSSDDSKGWGEVHRFSVPDRDTRDPHFLVFDDRLFVYTGTWLEPAEGQPRDLNAHLGYAAWTADGSSWEGPQALEGTYGHYIWRAAAYGGKAYLCGRRRRGFRSGVQGEADPADIEGAMLESDDGLVWRFSAFFAEERGDETAFLFEDDGSVVAIARGGGNVAARVCRSAPPYTAWTRTDLDRNVGGPLLAKWGDRYLVGGRKSIEPNPPATTIYWLADDALHEIAELPSGGDNSYPGFVALSEAKGLLSYYSSHEGSGNSSAPSAIYLAELSIDR